MEYSAISFLGAVSRVSTLVLVLTCMLIGLSTAGATSVPSLSFEELTDRSEVVAAGKIDRAWADWDAEHKYIWTHYELKVSAALKGTPGATVILSEPGGLVDIQGMSIAGSVGYQAGEAVLVFLQRMPNGYLRTAGWSQGKFTVDESGRVHPSVLPGGLRTVDTKGDTRSGNTATSLRSIDGMRVSDLRGLVLLRNQAQKGIR
jgi:hypothetical protein